MKNGSFEADRRHIPSPVKPVQIQLTGWVSEVLEGNKIGLDSINSPVLNHFNTESERKIVIGEKSLNISDKVNFKRKIFQIMSSSPYVKLEDGSYILTAKIKNSNGFTNLEMYALSNSKTFNSTIKNENADWKTIVIKNIAVKGGKVEVGFKADANANAFCLVDDVSLVKN